MATYRPGFRSGSQRSMAVERFTIATADDLELARFALEDGGEHVVLLDVPTDSDQLTNVREYREMLTLAEMAGMQVKLLSDDPVRIELARIVGMAVIEPHERAGLHDVESRSAAATRARLQAVELAGTAATSHAVSAGTGRFATVQRDLDDDPFYDIDADLDDDVDGADEDADDAAQPGRDDLSATAVRRADDPTRRIASTLSPQPERYRPWQTGGEATGRNADVALSPDAADPSFAFLSSSAPFPARNPAVDAHAAAAGTGQPISVTQQRRVWTSTSPVAPAASGPAAASLSAAADAQVTAVRPQAQAHAQAPGHARRPSTAAAAPRGRRRSRLGAVLVVGLVLALLLGGGGYAAAVVLPSASVTLTPQRTPVEVTFTYGVATAGANWDLLIEPTPTSRTLSASATVPTTGERLEPDQAARGDVLVTNPLPWDVTIAAGTLFFAEDGQQFAAVEDSFVPAADPYGTLTFGSTTVSVVASVGGSVGNVPPDTVNGQLDEGVYYTNRTAFGGGTDRTLPVVQQADIDNLQAQLRTQVEQQVPGASAELVGSEQHLVPGSEQSSAITFDIPTQVGSDATELTGSASLTVSAQVYSLANTHGDAQAAALERLGDAVGEQQVLDADSVVVGTPEAIDASGLAFRVHATGEADAIIDQQVLDTMRQDLGGVSADEARARLLNVPGVATVDIDSRWGWLSDGMPERSGNIDLTIADDGNATMDSSGDDPLSSPSSGTDAGTDTDTESTSTERESDERTGPGTAADSESGSDGGPATTTNP